MPPPPSHPAGPTAAAILGSGGGGRFRRQARGSPARSGPLAGLEDEVEKDIGLVSEKTGMPTWAVVSLMILILGRG